jgi:hypothetical protein
MTSKHMYIERTFRAISSLKVDLTVLQSFDTSNNQKMLEELLGFWLYTCVFVC